MAGHLLYLIGGSGSGKDSLLHAIAAQQRPDIVIAQRHITRPVTPDEDHIALSTEAFHDNKKNQRYALDWSANGCLYGIDNTINTSLADGKTVIVNGSRGYLTTARQRYPNLRVVSLWVSNAKLEQRLINRGRDSATEVAARIARNQAMNQQLEEQAATLPYFHALNNDGALSDTVAAFWNWLATQYDA